MLKVYAVMIRVIGMLRGVLTQIERHDRDLGNQLRRAASSVALNIQEGSGSHGGTRLARYRTALGSARETGACLDVALALGYVERVDAGKLLDAAGSGCGPCWPRWFGEVGRGRSTTASAPASRAGFDHGLSCGRRQRQGKAERG